MYETAKQTDDNNRRDWITEQFKCLEEERNAFDRYLWQVPVATLAIIALVLRAFFTIGANDKLICLGMLISSFICAYGALLVARLHQRKSIRCARIIELEELMGKTSIVRGGDARKYPELKSERFVNKHIGIISTAVLGVFILTLMAVISAMYCIISFIRIWVN